MLRSEAKRITILILYQKFEAYQEKVPSEIWIECLDIIRVKLARQRGAVIKAALFRNREIPLQVAPFCLRLHLIAVTKKLWNVKFDCFIHTLMTRHGNKSIYKCAFRNARGRLVIHIMLPVEIQRTDDLRTDLQINTQPITNRVEQAVRNYPEQLNLTLKRRKNFSPHSYPESKKPSSR